MLSVKCTASLRSVTHPLKPWSIELHTGIVNILFVTAVVWANKDRTRCNGNNTETGAINRMWSPIFAGTENVINRDLDF